MTQPSLVIIQQAAVNGETDLGQVLRMCKVLASRLDSKPLDDWLVWESEGYPPAVEVPAYRNWALEIKGHFSGAFGSGLRHAPIPHVCIPESVRDRVTEFQCRQSVSSIAGLLKHDKGKTLHVNLGDLSVLLGTKVYENMSCLQAWGEVGSAHLTEVLNAVRNKVLDFSIALGKAYPSLLTADDDVQRVAPDRVSQVFNTTVYGGALSVVGTAANSSIMVSGEIRAQDVGSLQRHLAAIGVAKADLHDLEQALGDDPFATETRRFGPRVAVWMGKMLTKAAEGAWNVGVDTAGAVLSAAISKYYGWS